MRQKSLDDTIVALSTPVGDGGIGIVRLSGEDALALANEIFVARSGKQVATFATHTTHYGHIVDKGRAQKTGGGEIIDEVLMTVMRAPKTYTKEDIVEVNCHGGIEASRRVLELALRHGARMAEPGEFTKRAFLNGRIDLAQAEAVLDTIRAKTAIALKAALAQLDGGFSERVDRIREAALGIASRIEASIDFPDEELAIASGDILKSVDDVITDLKKFIATSKEGIILREGILAVICGRPNAGKSSLMNLLLRRDRVIVTPVPGTTRDAVEEMISVKGIPIRLVDTAGIGATKDVVEKEGIRRSKKYLEEADIVLLVLDNSKRTDREDARLMKLVEKKKKVVIINKTDLRRRIDIEKVRALFAGEKIVEVSVVKKRHIDLLEKTIADMIWTGDIQPGESAIVTNTRHRELLRKALCGMESARKALGGGEPCELAAIDMKEAIYNLGLITGRSVSDDILERIFSEFCVGK